jgi:hypothetical protein
MTGFEVAGVMLTGPAVVGQLLKVSIEGYKAFSEAQAAGKELRQRQRDLEVARHRLEDWIHDLGKVGGDLWLVFEQDPQRYITLLETLASIAEVFAKVELLQSKYGIKCDNPDGQPSSATSIHLTETSNSDEAAQRRRKRDWFKGLFHLETSDSNGSRLLVPSPKLPRGGSAIALPKQVVSPFTNLPLPSNSGSTVLKYSRDLELAVPEVREMVSQMEKKAEQYQQTLSTYHRYEWVFSGHEELRSLIKDLNGYTTDLENMTKIRFQGEWTQWVRVRFSELTEEGILISQQSVTFSEFRVPTKLPLPQDPKFCGREDILVQIQQCFFSEGTDISSLRRVIVLTGLGGIGKSQIALEYAYRYASSDTSVFWINATNKETVDLSSLRIMENLICHYVTKYRDSPDFPRIAADLGVPGKINSSGKLIVETGQSVWEMVRAWLSKAGNRGWYLVIDGYDDVNLLNPSDMLPPGRHGYIIVTSRDREVAAYLHGSFIEIPEIEKASGLNLLVKGDPTPTKSFIIRSSQTIA